MVIAGGRKEGRGKRKREEGEDFRVEETRASSSSVAS